MGNSFQDCVEVIGCVANRIKNRPMTIEVYNDDKHMGFVMKEDQILIVGCCEMIHHRSGESVDEDCKALSTLLETIQNFRSVPFKFAKKLNFGFWENMKMDIKAIS